MRPDFAAIDARNEELRRKLEEMKQNRTQTPDQAPPRVEMTGRAGEVSATAVARQDAEAAASRRAMAQVGKEWALTDPVFERGSRVNEIGVRNFTREGEELRAAGLLTDNIVSVEKVIAAERRTVVPCNITDLRLEYDKTKGLAILRKEQGKLLPVTASVIEGICDYFPATFAKVKQGLIHSVSEGGMDPEDKVRVFNRFVETRVSSELGGRRTGDLAMVGRIQAGQWQAWTVRGPKNTANEVDGGEYLKLIREAVKGSDLFGEVDYNPASGRVSFSGWTMPNVIVDLSAGDVFKVGISGSTNDCKAGKYKINFNVIRNLCHNLIILGYEGAVVFEATHNSKPERVIAGIREGMMKSDAAVNEFRELWGTLRSVSVPEVDESADRTDDVLALMREIATQVRQPGHTTDATVEMLMNAWHEEEGDTYADIHNAVSRLYMQKEIDAFVLAQKAGELLPVLVGQAREVM